MIHISEENEARIIDELMHQIVSNVWEPGDKLPSENKLIEKYCVTRIKVRNTKEKLEQRRNNNSKQRKGQYMKEKSMKIELHLTGKSIFTDKMKQLGYDLKTSNIYCEQISYDA